MQTVALQQSQARDDFAGTGVDGDEHVVAQRQRHLGDRAQMNVESGGRSEPARRREHLAAANLVLSDADEVGRNPRSGFGPVLFLPVGLEASYARALARDD